MKLARFTVEMDSSLVADLEAFATDRGRDVSEILNEAVRGYLDRRRGERFDTTLEESLEENAELGKLLAE